MEQIFFQDRYPLYTTTIPKEGWSLESLVQALIAKIQAHPVATFITTFDHYAHTKGLPEGHIAPSIQGAINILFCFGKELQDPLVVAVRPRSIGIVEEEEGFVISFMEAPNPQANETMQGWVESLASGR
ncbi:MAG: hypothetical protein C6I00_07560 [Nitratiruptor sp.]|nr:hypothetical protein [Nitratiruptor sp.]NPA82947.1 hypothetical protein [Campylobacterota bacterium]